MLLPPITIPAVYARKKLMEAFESKEGAEESLSLWPEEVAKRRGANLTDSFEPENNSIEQ